MPATATWQRHSVAGSHRPLGVYGALCADWEATTRRDHARRAMRAWAERNPAMAAYSCPGELVTDIGQLGNPDRSCQLLSDLLVLAGSEPLAARAVLQALLPGLRAAGRRRWRKAADAGPWTNDQEIAADSLHAGWDAIQAHAGQRHPRPAAVIIRHVEGRLRRDHDRWLRTADHSSILDLRPCLEAGQPILDAGDIPEHQAVSLVTDALRSGTIDRRQAALLLATGVAGHTVVEAACQLALPPAVAYRALGHARSAMRAYAAGSDGPDELVHPFSNERPPASPVQGRPQPSTTGAAP